MKTQVIGQRQTANQAIAGVVSRIEQRQANITAHKKGYRAYHKWSGKKK